MGVYIVSTAELDCIAQDSYKTYFNKSEDTESQSGHHKLKVNESGNWFNDTNRSFRYLKI